MATVLVYGTLKRGERNHSRLAAATFLGPAMTRDFSFTLAEYASVSRPGARTPEAAAGGTHRISGELYTVPPELLAELDAFERVGIDYQRQAVPLLGGGMAEIYLRATAATRPALLPAHRLLIRDAVASWSERLSA